MVFGIQKIIFLLVLIGVLVVTAVYFSGSKQNIENNTVIHEDEIVEWTTYEDGELDFIVSYPSHLQTIISIEEEKTPFGTLIRNVSFGLNREVPGHVGVKVYSDIAFNTIDVFLELRRRGKERIRYDIDKEFMVNGIPVTVFHLVTVGPEGQEEHFLYTRYAALIKDGMLFELWSKFNNEEKHEQVWQSFGFVEK